ncbi:hypothetical protein Tco_0929755 [Tanacetum coccineum]
MPVARDVLGWKKAVIQLEAISGNREPLPRHMGDTTQRDTGTYSQRDYEEYYPKKRYGSYYSDDTGMNYGKLEVT